MKKFIKWFLILLVIIFVTSAVISSMDRQKKLKEPHIGLVTLEGILYDIDFVSGALDDFARNPMITGVLVRVNSPGGVVTPSQELYSLIRHYPKPVWAFHDGLAASGALFATIGADRIGTQSTTITGSIGVIIRSINARELYEKIGIEEITVKTGPFKNILSTNQPLGDDERRILEELIGDSYDEFVNAIASSRDMDKQLLIDIADGRIFSGLRAVEYGLADEISSYHEFRNKFAQELQVHPDNYFVYQRSRGERLRELLSTVQATFDTSVSMMYLLD
ncbi:signal peptide peptidase SppA, 36K type [Desulfurispirillum indicum S5]|uniref:Signal peptide peptidase SppA, 36K type n=1 Tax=Desulfurispirillum indicum (strain ATCC BAA-1389 / DSM 22839 / S5) TaxID=653733 RepID=E6W4F8_DESIS|nr:signal peptide peptidase SppA [Desulfurispirillum indicum]ADU65932.1 signal peptide peptidase SppA, 36K type [Desulfurispirillum indicum S5]